MLLISQISYLGHTLRHTSATLLANSGASMDEIMRLGSWKSINSAKRYFTDSLKNKQRTENKIASELQPASNLKIALNNEQNNSNFQNRSGTYKPIERKLPPPTSTITKPINNDHNNNFYNSGNIYPA